MSLNVWRLVMPLFLIMVIPSIASSADHQPDIFDVVYDVGSFLIKQKAPDTIVSLPLGQTVTAEIPLSIVKVVPFNSIKAVIENPNPHNWYDPYWDSAGWGAAKDIASTASTIPGYNVPFTVVGGFLIVAQNNNDLLEK